MIYITADLHLNHRNIIRYCNRPFSSIDEMNETLVRNWNATVKKNDVVYVVGDLAFGRDKHIWLKKLNGRIILIGGNHDYGLRTYPHLIIKYKEKKILLIHNPHDADGWDGWIIHGHKHNNNLKEYPQVNKIKRRINVSTELTKYFPISLKILTSWMS